MELSVKVKIARDVRKSYTLNEVVQVVLTHFRPMFPFYIPGKRQMRRRITQKHLYKFSV